MAKRNTEPGTVQGNTEQRIMDAAEELFLDRGYMLATTVKIAERAGVTHAMLHYYFRTKEQIFLKVLDKNLNGFIGAVRPVMTATGNGNVWETLKGGITVFFDYLNTHRRLAPMLYDVLRNNPELLRSYRKSLAEMSERVRNSHVTMLRKEMDGGRMNRTDIGQLFYSIMTMCISTFLTIPVLDGMQGKDPADLDRFMDARKTEILDTIYLRLYGKA